MPTIYIHSRDTKISVDQTQFTLRSQGKKYGRIPPTMMDELIVESEVEITRKALDRLGRMGIATSFLGNDGDITARLVAPWKHDARPRIEQARVFMDTEKRVQLARTIVDAKIHNQIAVLRKYQKNHQVEGTGDTVKTLTQHRKALQQAQEIDTLMGHEGASTKAYYAQLSRFLRCDWTTFEGRNKRPPKDPVNAALSYAYTILTNRIHSFCESAGLDPYIAFLHGSEPRRPALALDLIEPFRPILADRFVWKLFNQNSLKREDFDYPNGECNGLRLSRDARKHFIHHFIDYHQKIDYENPFDEDAVTSPGKYLLDTIEAFRNAALKGELQHFQPLPHATAL